MKNKYNEMIYKYCAEIKVSHKAKGYSFLDVEEKRNLENAVFYTDSNGGKNYHLFLKDCDEQEIMLVYEYNDYMEKEQLEELLKKDLSTISDCIYSVSPKVRTLLHSGRRFLFKKEKTVITV